MALVIFVAVLLALILLPQVWVRRVMAVHAADRQDLPGTGGELARHLLDLAGLPQVRVERSVGSGGDHYDSKAKVVRLSDGNHDGRSITAVAVAAHEVAHALQDAEGYRLLALRTRLARAARTIQFVAGGLLIAAPLVMAVAHSPQLLLLQLGAGLVLLGSVVVLHLVTLPVELDASFARALPILRQGRYLDDGDLPAAQRVLQAAALTYVAASLVSLLNIMRWLRFLRF